MKNSAGTITPPQPVKGVKLTDVLAAVGGMTDSEHAATSWRPTTTA